MEYISFKNNLFLISIASYEKCITVEYSLSFFVAGTFVILKKMMFFLKGTHGAERKTLVEIKTILVTLDQDPQNLIIIPVVHLSKLYNQTFRTIQEN